MVHITSTEGPTYFVSKSFQINFLTCKVKKKKNTSLTLSWTKLGLCYLHVWRNLSPKKGSSTETKHTLAELHQCTMQGVVDFLAGCTNFSALWHSIQWDPEEYRATQLSWADTFAIDKCLLERSRALIVPQESSQKYSDIKPRNAEDSKVSIKSNLFLYRNLLDTLSWSDFTGEDVATMQLKPVTKK